MERKFHADFYSELCVSSNELQIQIMIGVPRAGTGPGRSRPENFHTHFQRSLCKVRWCPSFWGSIHIWIQFHGL